MIFDNLDKLPRLPKRLWLPLALPELEDRGLEDRRETAEQIETETSTDAAVESEQDERDAGTRQSRILESALEGKWCVLHLPAMRSA